MKGWYYAKDGQRNGPVSLDDIQRLLAGGSLRETDLVWREGMTDWMPAAGVPELKPAAPAIPPPPPMSAPADDSSNPYHAPVSSYTGTAAEVTAPGEEIVPGSQPIDIGECISRAFELTKRHFWFLLGVGAIYMVASIVMGVVLEVAGMPFEVNRMETEGFNAPPMSVAAGIAVNLVNQLFGIYIGLGLTRIGLNLVSGQNVAIGMLFGEGGKLLNSAVATFLYAVMVALGTLLLIVPGIYLALRFSQYQAAIVDKNLGAIEALKYSARLTQGNKLNLFLLWFVCAGLVLAGIVALLVGLAFALPMVYLISYIAYRWMQYGPGVVTD